jgi:hypothetical protein
VGLEHTQAQLESALIGPGEKRLEGSSTRRMWDGKAFFTSDREERDGIYPLEAVYLVRFAGQCNHIIRMDSNFRYSITVCTREKHVN